MHDQSRTSLSSSSSPNVGPFAWNTALPPQVPSPKLWDTIAGVIAAGVFGSQGSFTEFKHSTVAQRLVALRIPREVFNLHLIGAIARELVPGITNRQDLCRTAWVFHKLGVTDYKLKADLASRALELIQNSAGQEFSQEDQELVINTLTRLGKIQISDNALVAALATEMNNMFPVSTSTFLSNLRVLNVLTLLTNGMQQLDSGHQYSKEFTLVRDLIFERCDALLKRAKDVDLSNDELLLIANAYGACEKVPYKYFDFLPSLKDVLDAQVERKNSSLQEKTRILAFIINHVRMYGPIRDLAWSFSYTLHSHENIPELALNSIIHLANGFPLLAGLEQKSSDYHLPADLCVSMMHLCARKILERTSFDSLTPDEIVSLIRNFAFAIQFEEPCAYNPDEWRKKNLAKGLVKAIKEDSTKAPLFRIVLENLVSRMVAMGIGDHLKFDSLAGLVLAIIRSKLETGLERTVLDLLASRISNPEALQVLSKNKHEVDSVLNIYLQSEASIDAKDLVITSIARKISEETFQLPSREVFDALDRKSVTLPYQQRPSYTDFIVDSIVKSNVMALCTTFANALDDGSCPHAPEKIAAVTEALSTLGNALTYFVQDLDVFKRLLTNDYYLKGNGQLLHCLASQRVIQGMSMTQVVTLLIHLHQSDFRVPKEDHNLEPGRWPSIKTMALKNLVKCLASAPEAEKLSGEAIASVLQTLGQSGLQGKPACVEQTSSIPSLPKYELPGMRPQRMVDEHLASVIDRLAGCITPLEILDSLNDAQLVYAAQGLGLPNTTSEQVYLALGLIANRLRCNYRSSSRLDTSDPIEIAYALGGLSRHVQPPEVRYVMGYEIHADDFSNEISYAMNLLANHLPQDLAPLSDQLVAEMIGALCKVDRPLPGVPTTMCRLVQRWKELGRIQVSKHATGTSESWYYVKESSSSSLSNWQPPCDVHNEVLGLARWLAQPEVTSQMSPREVVYLLTLFSGSNCVAEEIRAAIDAMGTKLANEESTKALSQSEVQAAVEIFRQSGLGTAGVTGAIEMLTRN